MFEGIFHFNIEKYMDLLDRYSNNEALSKEQLLYLKKERNIKRICKIINRYTKRVLPDPSIELYDTYTLYYYVFSYNNKYYGICKDLSLNYTIVSFDFRTNDEKYFVIDMKNVIEYTKSNVSESNSIVRNRQLTN